MKLGEAFLERDALEARLELLESRIPRFLQEARALDSLFQEIERTAQGLQELDIAIAWTKQQAALSGVTLAALETQIEYRRKLAEAWESVAEHEKADRFWKEAQHKQKVVQAAAWLVDLQTPPTSVGEEPGAKEEEE